MHMIGITQTAEELLSSPEVFASYIGVFLLYSSSSDYILLHIVEIQELMQVILVLKMQIV